MTKTTHSLDPKALFDLFNTTIGEERRAQELYRRAAQLAGDDSELAALFLELAEEERSHEQRLMKRYGEIKRSLEARTSE
jgi:rubrerythrin